MAGKFYQRGLNQLIPDHTHSYHARLPTSNNYYWTTQTTATNTTVLSQQLLQDTIDQMKKDINRQCFGIYPAPQIDYSDHVVSKGIRELPNKLDILKLM